MKALELTLRAGDLAMRVAPGEIHAAKPLAHSRQFASESLAHAQPCRHAIKEKRRLRLVATERLERRIGRRLGRLDRGLLAAPHDPDDRLRRYIGGAENGAIITDGNRHA